jgi:hypothetical protein
MGSVCCCCRDAEVESSPPREERPQQGARWQAMNTSTPQDKTRCDICSRVVDPCLLDGHRESCRAQHRKKMREQQINKPSPSLQPAPPPPFDDDLPPELLCIVCMEGRKEYAFVPCGHVVGCSKCVKLMDSCPVCRTPRKGLLKLDVEDSKRCLCKHCGHVITPAYFEGHREVCSLQMRQLRQQEGTPPAALVHHENELKSCVNCKLAERDTALLPCGHRVLCGPCALSTPSCPVCLTSVSSVVTTYET